MVYVFWGIGPFLQIYECKVICNFYLFVIIICNFYLFVVICNFYLFNDYRICSDLCLFLFVILARGVCLSLTSFMGAKQAVRLIKTGVLPSEFNKERNNGVESVCKGAIINDNVGLPWWRSGWESACQCRGHGFEPWSGKILHAAEQLGPWATATEPARLEPVLRNKRGHDNERPAHRNEEWPPLAATGESPRTETKTQHSHK